MERLTYFAFLTYRLIQRQECERTWGQIDFCHLNWGEIW